MDKQPEKQFSLTKKQQIISKQPYAILNNISTIIKQQKQL